MYVAQQVYIYIYLVKKHAIQIEGQFHCRFNQINFWNFVRHFDISEEYRMWMMLNQFYFINWFFILKAIFHYIRLRRQRFRIISVTVYAIQFHSLLVQFTTFQLQNFWFSESVRRSSSVSARFCQQCFVHSYTLRETVPNSSGGSPTNHNAWQFRYR